MTSHLESSLEKMIVDFSERDTKNLLQFKIFDLLTDKTGISLFYFYLYQQKNKGEYYDSAFEIIEEAIAVHNNYHVVSASTSKFNWLLMHLNHKEIIEIDTKELFLKNDKPLYENMLKFIYNNNYDFLHGALGIVLYFLQFETTNKTVNNYLHNFIDEFEKVSEKAKNGGVKWLSTIDYKTGKKAYNISMSHGIASIIAILSKVYKRSINKQKTKYLLESAMNYLLQQKLPKGKFNSVFPNLALESTDKLYPSRLAWCYGDLGISVAIWHASQALERKDWEEEAVNILLHSAKRRNLKENGVVDAGLCHGTAGIAHIFNRMYGYTGIEELKEASDYWFEQTIKMAKFEDGLAGYKAWHGNEGWKNEAGLLEGVAGIGLALISAVSDIDPAWDECLLLS